MPAMAGAQGPCPLVKAMMAEKPARLAGIGVTVDGQGLVDLTLNGKPDLLRGAADCSLTGPDNDFEVDCSWSFAGADSARAEAAFAALKRRLDVCLPEPLEPRPAITRSPEELSKLAAQYGTAMIESIEKRKSLHDYSQTYPAGEESALHVRLSLSHDTRYNTLSLSASFSRY